MVEIRMCCPSCNSDWQIGWESFNAVKEYLLIGIGKLKTGLRTFHQCKCAQCQKVFNIKDLHL